jgi:ubiquinone/menaquinone biosynthesis C-methylase UbiE
MKLNWAERLVVNNPLRAFEQEFEIRWMKRSWPLDEGRAILEVGCGRGAGASRIIKEFNPSVLHVMDLDIRMVKKAKRILAPAEQGKLAFYVGDVVDLPYPDHNMDAVFCFGVLHHVPKWRDGLAEITRVLKPGGILFIEELYPTLYQNFITRHILLHPTEDRFMGEDFRSTAESMNLKLEKILEIRYTGFLAVMVKGD